MRFYISPRLGEQPARLVRELIGGDTRFFPPEEESTIATAAAASPVHGDHNYNANQALFSAIRDGARGAYWDILRKFDTKR